MPKNPKFKLTERELYLAVAFAIIGFVLSLREVINGLDTLNPLIGLVIYYFILYVSLYILSHMGLTIFGLKIENTIQVLGLGLITFAFFILVNWESEYVYLVANGTVDHLPQLYFASEDGAVWYLWYHVAGIKDIEIARLLTFVLTPFLLALGGGFLLEQRPTISESIEWNFFRRKKKR